ncbi:hypothetical protein TB1_005504 [Malus domestica]
MESLEAMTKGSDQRYLGNTAKLEIVQGVVRAVADKGSILKFIPYTVQAVKQGFQDFEIVLVILIKLHAEEESSSYHIDIKRRNTLPCAFYMLNLY